MIVNSSNIVHAGKALVKVKNCEGFLAFFDHHKIARQLRDRVPAI